MSADFLTHLLSLLNIYERGVDSPLVPRYDGPRDWQTDAIERGLANVARRMYTAESFVESISEHEKTGPKPKKRRSGSSSPSSSSSSSRKSSPPTQDAPPSNGINGSKQHRTSPMTICLDDIPPILDPTLKTAISASAPAASTQPADYFCPTCGRWSGSSVSLTEQNHTDFNGLGPSLSGLDPNGSPLIVPPGPLTVAAYESGMSAVEELRLLKAQVQDVARVCKVRSFVP